MLIRLHKNASESELERLLGICAELGYEASFLDDSRQLVELHGTGRPWSRSRLEDCACVVQVIDHHDAPELYQRTPGRADTVVCVGQARFGGDHASLIAGPCAVEDRDRLLEIARGVRELGAVVLRGGAYKPRTSPYSFQGLGKRGLELLAEARAETGLAIVTEVLDPRDVEVVSEVADMLQVGSRSMFNSVLLSEIGRTRKPVLLKRGMAASVRELLLAAEYILARGNEEVVLCERGIRGFDSTTRNLLDVGGIAHLKRATHLPVIVDPSHAAGREELVRPLARAGMAAGADGLIVEVHPNPDEVHSDGAQAVSLETLGHIAGDARAILELDGRKLVNPERELAFTHKESAQ